MNYLKGFLDKNSDQTIFEDYLSKNYRVICLDSSNEKYQNGYISEESCELLRQALRRKTGLPTFLITHHNYWINNLRCLKQSIRKNLKT